MDGRTAGGALHFLAFSLHYVTVLDLHLMQNCSLKSGMEKKKKKDMVQLVCPMAGSQFGQ